jgi:hypothetical protein
MKITREQLKKMIREEIRKKPLNEANSIADYKVSNEVKPLLKKSLENLILMSGNGEIVPDVLRDIAETLLSARRKYFTSQKTSADRSAAVDKGKITKLAKKAEEELTDYVIGLLKKDIENGGPLQPGYHGDPAFGHEFALSLGTDPNRKLQKKYDDLKKQHWPKFRDKYNLPKDTKLP